MLTLFRSFYFSYAIKKNYLLTNSYKLDEREESSLDNKAISCFLAALNLIPLIVGLIGMEVLKNKFPSQVVFYSSVASIGGVVSLALLVVDYFKSYRQTDETKDMLTPYLTSLRTEDEVQVPMNKSTLPADIMSSQKAQQDHSIQLFSN